MSNQPAQQQLTPEQALSIIHQAARLAKLNFDETVMVERSADLLRSLVSSVAETPAPEKKAARRGRRSSKATPAPVEEGAD